MLPLIGTVFVASLLGSLHCVGMCGPLAMLASSNQSRSHKNVRQVNVQAVLAYHGSRIVAYAIAGAIAGLIGAGIQQTGDLFGWQRLAARLAGGSMLVIGLLSIVRLAGGTSHSVWMPAWLQRRLHQGHTWARRQPPVARAATIGLLTAILPCGWLFAFLIVAAGTAGAFAGAMVMATFALGSVPALAGLAMSMTLLIGRFRTLVPWFSAVLITIVGGATLVSRSHIELDSMIVQPPRTSTASAKLLPGAQAGPIDSAGVNTTGTASKTMVSGQFVSAVAAVQAIDATKLPCCCQKPGAVCENTTDPVNVQESHDADVGEPVVGQSNEP